MHEIQVDRSLTELLYYIFISKVFVWLDKIVAGKLPL